MTYKKVKELDSKFNILLDNLNHKVTQIENDIKWMSRIGYYMATAVTAIAIKSIFFN